MEQQVKKRKLKACYPKCMFLSLTSLILWGCISSKGVGRQNLLEGNVDSSVKADSFKEYLKPTI